MSDSPSSAQDASDQESLAPSRRRVLTGAAVVAAIAGVGATVSATVGATEASATPLRRGAGSEPIVAHVRDVRTGAIDVFSNGREVTIYDRELAVKLANAGI